MGRIARQPKEMHVTTMRPGIEFWPGVRLRPAAGGWRVDPTQAHAAFAAGGAGRAGPGQLPLTGRGLIAEQIEDSTAWLAARAGHVSTRYPQLEPEPRAARFRLLCCTPAWRGGSA